MELNSITEKIIEAAFRVHTFLGPGLLERPYQMCLKHELTKCGMKVCAEVGMPVIYDDTAIDIGYRLDLLVEDRVIIELKSVESIALIHRVQLLTYLRLSRMPLGLILNFGAEHLRNGIIRIINSSSANLCDLRESSAFQKSS